MSVGSQWHNNYHHLDLALIASILTILIAGIIPQASAHPVYVDSSPGAFQSVPSSPREVNVFFSEPIELGYSSISVLGPDGGRVDMNDPHNVEGDTASIGVAMQPGLPEGEYTVSTKVLSAVDGHVVEETFIFGVGTQVSALAAASSRRTSCRQKNLRQGFPAWSGR